MTLALVTARARVYRKVRVLLDALLPEKVAAVNTAEGLVGGQALVMPKMVTCALNLGDVLLQNPSVVDGYPALSFYPTSSSVDVDVDSTYSVEDRFILEAFDYVDSGSIDVAAERAELLCLCALDVLRENLADNPEFGEQVIISVEAPSTAFSSTDALSNIAWQVSAAAEVMVVTRLDKPRNQTSMPWSMAVPSSIPSLRQAVTATVSGDSTPAFAASVDFELPGAVSVTSAQAAGYTTLQVVLGAAVAVESRCTVFVLTGNVRSVYDETSDGATFEFARASMEPADGEQWMFVIVDADSGARTVFNLTWTIT